MFFPALPSFTPLTSTSIARDLPMSTPVDPQLQTPTSKTPTKNSADTARRSFLKAGTVASAGVVAGLTTVRPVRGAEPQNASEEPVRIGLVGAGGRGSGAINDSLTINENVTLSAIADVEEQKLESVRKGTEKDRVFLHPKLASNCTHRRCLHFYAASCLHP